MESEKEAPIKSDFVEYRKGGGTKDIDAWARGKWDASAALQSEFGKLERYVGFEKNAAVGAIENTSHAERKSLAAKVYGGLNKVTR